MSYGALVRSNQSLIGFGVLTAFSTSFGQTFFISLFVPQFLQSFGLGEATFGILYAVATHVTVRDDQARSTGTEECMRVSRVQALNHPCGLGAAA